MAVDAGKIRSEAELDLKQFLAATRQLESAVRDINRQLEGIKPARIEPPKDVGGWGALRNTLRGLGDQLDDVASAASSGSVSFATLGRAVGGVGPAALAGAAAIGVLAAAYLKGAEAAAQLQHEVAFIQTIKPEIDTRTLERQLTELSTTVPQTAAQLAEAVYNIFSSFEASQEQAVRLVELFAKGATAARTDAQTFGTAVLGVLNAYKLGVEDAERVSDLFFNTVNAGVITGRELATALGPVTQSAKQVGLAFEDLSVLIAAVTREGGNAAQNVNNLDNLLRKLATKEAAQEFAALGISLQTTSGALKDPIQLLGELRERMAGMSDAARVLALQRIFPDAQARAGASVILSQMDFVLAKQAEFRADVGATERAYATMAGTVVSQSQRMQNALTALGAEFASTFGAQDVGFQQQVTRIATSLRGLVTAAKGPMQEFRTAVARGFADALDAAEGFTVSFGRLVQRLQRHAEQVGNLPALIELPDFGRLFGGAAREIAPDVILRAMGIPTPGALRAALDAFKRQAEENRQEIAAEQARTAALFAHRAGERQAQSAGPGQVDLAGAIGANMGRAFQQMREMLEGAREFSREQWDELIALWQGNIRTLEGLQVDPTQFTEGLIRGLNQATPGAAQAFADLIHEAASAIAGAMASTEGDTEAAVAALVEGYKARLRAQFPGLGEEVINLVAQHVEARGRQAFEQAATSAEAFFAKLNAGTATINEITAAAKGLGEAFSPEAWLTNPNVTQASIEAILRYQQTLQQTQQQLGQLTDFEVRAAAQRLLNQGKLAEAAELTSAHLAAQAETQRVAGEAAQRAAQDVNAIEEAMRRAATVAQDEYGSRLAQLANAVLPQLNNETANAVRQQLILGQNFAAAELALNAVGLSVEDFAGALGGSQQQMARAARAAAAMAAEFGGTGVSARTLEERFTAMANAALPALASATANHVRLLLEMGQQQQAAAVATQALGVELASAGSVASQSAADFADTVRQLERIAQAVDPNRLFGRELESRADAVLGAMKRSASASEAAWLEFGVAMTGSVAGAVRRALAQMGGDLNAFDAAMQGSAAEAQAYADKVARAIDALRTGRIAPVAPQTDAVDQFIAALSSANEALQQAEQQMQEALAAAAETLRQAVEQIQAALSQAEESFQATLLELADESAAIEDSFQATLAGIASSLASALAAIDKARAAAWEAFVEQVENAKQTLDRTVETAHANYVEKIKDLNEREAEAYVAAMEQMTAATSQLASQLSQIREQSIQVFYQFSTQLEDLNRELLSGVGKTAEQWSELARRRIRLEAEFGFQQQGLVSQEQQARKQFQDAVKQVTDSLAKELREMEKERRKAEQEFQQQVADAQRAYNETIQQAQEQFDKQMKELAQRAAEAERKAGQERMRALQEREKRRQELEKRRQEAKRRLDDAREKARKDMEKAEQEYQQRVDKIRQEHEKAVDRFLKETRKAREDFLRAVKALQDVLGKNNTLLEEVLRRRGIEMRFDFDRTNVQETAVDFLKVATQKAEERLRVT